MKDYAKPQSFAYQVHYIQRRRKKRKSSGDDPLPPPTPVQRYITDLSPAAGSRYDLSSSYQVPNDAVISFKFASTSFENRRAFFSGSLAATNTFCCDMYNGNIRVFYYNGTTASSVLSAPTASLFDGRVHQITLTLSGSNATLSVDGSVKDSSTTWSRSGNENIAYLGYRPGQASNTYLDGYLYDFSIYEEGVAILDYALDSNFSSVSTENNTGSAGGSISAINISESELFTLNTDTNPEQWENSDKSVILPIASTEVFY